MIFKDRIKSTFAVFIIFGASIGCSNNDREIKLNNFEISAVIGLMTEVMVNDVTNPPLASRFYAYACLAGYEIVAQNDKAYETFYGRLNDYPKLTKPKGLSNYDYKLAAVLAIMETASRIQPSGKLIAAYEDAFLDSLSNIGVSTDVIDGSLTYAKAISTQILEYARNDNYAKTTAFQKYYPLNEEGKWYPTPPGYFEPVEPHFKEIRPFTLTTSDQFKPLSPIEFSTKKDSPFFDLLMEVYQEGSNLSADRRAIAAFWDCNPFALQDKGHLMVGMKKISPGAHWMGITGIVAKDQELSFSKAMKIYAVVAISLMDGFIACWDEKYRSHRIRPETAIRKLIDNTWKPFLQTPPFPEYLSGHSTVSTAAAVVLSHYVGENVSFTDTIEVQYGLPSRNFSSFRQAADEAAISRLYGGIHFMDAIEHGQVQGVQVGNWIISKLGSNNNQGSSLSSQ